MGVDWQQSSGINPTQPLKNARFHRWYRFVLAYSDKLVTDLIYRYQITGDGLLVDPFCGTGTTLVAAKAAGIESVGIDSNPVAAFASKVKTNWDIDQAEAKHLVELVLARYKPFDVPYLPSEAPSPRLLTDLRQVLDGSPVAPRLSYFEASGMLKRGWMHELPMLQCFVLMHIIETSRASVEVRDLLRLALTCSIQEDTANVAYGPELFVKRKKLLSPKHAGNAFRRRAKAVLDDLASAPQVTAATQAYQADSRDLQGLVPPASITSLITSPPYPTEKDYTRNSRLELVFLGFVTDLLSLQQVKKQMVRSHSKGIYVQDDDSDFVKGVASVERVAAELAVKAATKSYGFAKLYPLIITEYFGGMRRHFRSLRPLMADGGIAAYVVGEQATYLQTYTPTATILGELASTEGFEVKEILPFRIRVGTTGNGRQIREEVLVLRA